jgi:hypothetical protein
VNNRARREGGRRHEDLEAVDAASPDPSPLDAVLERERHVLVRRALDALPDGYREVIGAYTAILVTFILRSNRRQRQIQVEDGTNVAVVLFITVSRAALRRPERYFAIARVELAAVLTLNALGVNLRWEHWMDAYRRSSLYDPSADLPVWMINVLLAVIGAWCFWRLRDMERSYGRATSTA